MQHIPEAQPFAYSVPFYGFQPCLPEERRYIFPVKKEYMLRRNKKRPSPFQNFGSRALRISGCNNYYPIGFQKRFQLLYVSKRILQMLKDVKHRNHIKACFRILSILNRSFLNPVLTDQFTCFSSCESRGVKAVCIVAAFERKLYNIPECAPDIQ